MPPAASSVLSTVSTVATGFSLRRLVRSAMRRKNATNSHSASLGADPQRVNASTRLPCAPTTVSKMWESRRPPSPRRPQNPSLQPQARFCHSERTEGCQLTHLQVFKWRLVSIPPPPQPPPRPPPKPPPPVFD